MISVDLSELTQVEQWALEYAVQEANKIRTKENEYWEQVNPSLPENEQQPIKPLFTVQSWIDDQANQLLASHVDNMMAAKKQHLIAAAEQLPPEVIAQLEAQFGIPPLIEGYSQDEPTEP